MGQGACLRKQNCFHRIFFKIAVQKMPKIAFHNSKICHALPPGVQSSVLFEKQVGKFVFYLETPTVGSLFLYSHKQKYLMY